MRDQLERFGPWIVAAGLGWCAWSGAKSQTGEKKPDRPRPPEVVGACLARRGDAEKLDAARDPFQADWAPYGAEFAPEFLAAERQKKEDAERDALLRANEEALARRKHEAEGATKRDAAAAAGFTLTLDAVAVSSEGASARICGRNVRVGEAIGGLGVDPAPTLVRVDGSSVDVEWLGRTYTVRIDDAPVLVAAPRADEPTPRAPAVRPPQAEIHR